MSRLDLFRRRAAWLFSERMLWATVALLLVTAAAVFVIHPMHEVTLRWWGMVLEFIGVGAVAHELRSTQMHFKRRGLKAWASAWIGRWPSRDGAAISLSSGVRIELTGSASGTVGWPKPGPNATVDERLAALQQEVESLRERATRTESGLAAERTEREAADKAEAVQREEDLKGLSAKVEEFAAGALSFSFFGLGCLAVGLFLTTASSELVKWPMLLSR